MPVLTFVVYIHSLYVHIYQKILIRIIFEIGERDVADEAELADSQGCAPTSGDQGCWLAMVPGVGAHTKGSKGCGTSMGGRGRQRQETDG